MSQSHQAWHQGWDGSRYRFGQTWIKMNFCLCIWFGESICGYIYFQKIFFAYNTDTFWGYFRYRTCIWFWFADPQFVAQSQPWDCHTAVSNSLHGGREVDVPEEVPLLPLVVEGHRAQHEDRRRQLLHLGELQNNVRLLLHRFQLGTVIDQRGKVL